MSVWNVIYNDETKGSIWVYEKYCDVWDVTRMNENMNYGVRIVEACEHMKSVVMYEILQTHDFMLYCILIWMAPNAEVRREGMWDICVCN